MTNTEIKKAWETMKKEIKKELGFEYGFTMSQKQINNGTATFLICNTIPYEQEISRVQASIEKVQGYTSWTEEEKARNKVDGEKTIARYTAQLGQYGTKENEAQVTLEQFTSSKAYEKFVSNFEKVDTSIECANDCYYIRFYYN